MSDTPRAEKPRISHPDANAGHCGGGPIEADRLAELTGLTDRRLRQIAKRGYYPGPVRGVYLDRDETERGLFRYYRELRELRDGLREEQEKETRARRKLLEERLRVSKRELVPLEEAADMIRRMLLPARQRLLGAPAELASRCNPSDPEFARRALQQWSDESLRYCGGEIEKL